MEGMGSNPKSINYMMVSCDRAMLAEHCDEVEIRLIKVYILIHPGPSQWRPGPGGKVPTDAFSYGVFVKKGAFRRPFLLFLAGA
jgi:hypothetical protein